MTLEFNWSDEKALGRAFSWLARIGACPKFGSRPIGWYQMHACRAIDVIKEHAAKRKLPVTELRCTGGMIQTKNGQWHDLLAANAVYDAADERSRRNVSIAREQLSDLNKLDNAPGAENWSSTL